MAQLNRRILYLVNALERDAPTSVTFTAASGMQKAGWDVTFLALSRGGNLAQDSSDACIRYGVVPGRTFVTKVLYLRTIIAAMRPHIVQTILARPALGLAAARVAGLRQDFAWIIGDHGAHEWHERGRLTGLAMERIMPAVYSLADAITAVSEFAATDISTRGIDPQKIQVVPNGVDPSRFYPRPRAERCALAAALFPADDPWEVWPLIGSAGNLRALKGHADLISAMPAVLQVWPAARLVIWGDGPECEHLTALAQQLGVDRAIALPGAQNAIEAKLPLLDLYVQPSRTESFGMAAAEAMCCGVPAVLSDAGGLPAIANFGCAAWLYSANDITALTDAMLAALYNKQRLQLRGSEGRGWILKNYTAEKMVSEVSALYETVLRQKGSTFSS